MLMPCRKYTLCTTQGFEVAMADNSAKVYQMRVLLKGISPIIWRRFLIRNDSSLADLHYTLQILMNWENYHLGLAAAILLTRSRISRLT